MHLKPQYALYQITESIEQNLDNEFRSIIP